MLARNVNAFPIFYDAAVQGEEPKFSIFQFNYACSDFSIIDIYFIINHHFVIEIMVKTNCFAVEAYFQNVSFAEDLSLRRHNSNFGSFDVNYHGDIRNFPHRFYNGLVLNEISISGIYPRTVHARLEHFFNRLL